MKKILDFVWADYHDKRKAKSNPEIKAKIIDKFNLAKRNIWSVKKAILMMCRSYQSIYSAIYTYIVPCQGPNSLPRVRWHLLTLTIVHNVWLLVSLGPMWWSWDMITAVIFLQVFQFFKASATAWKFLCAIYLSSTSVGWHLGCSLPTLRGRRACEFGRRWHSVIGLGGLRVQPSKVLSMSFLKAVPQLKHSQNYTRVVWE